MVKSTLIFLDIEYILVKLHSFWYRQRNRNRYAVGIR